MAEKEKHVVRGIVRHYHSKDLGHTPYRGVLKDENDEKRLGQSEHNWLQRLVSRVKDGTSVKITVEFEGKHPRAEGFVWVLTEPHHYERVPIEEEKESGG